MTPWRAREIAVNSRAGTKGSISLPQFLRNWRRRQRSFDSQNSSVEKEMKRTTFLAIVLLAFAFAAHAQDTTKKDAAVKPADPESKVVLDSWNEIGRQLTALAEDFPENKYDFKPTPAQRSFAEQLLHAAGSCYYFTNPAMGLKPPAAEDPKREQYKSKADIVAFAKTSFADGATAIQSKGEEGLMTEVVYYPQQKARVIDIAYGIVEHSGEHYGQLVVYYRLAGLVPPGPRPKK